MPIVMPAYLEPIASGAEPLLALAVASGLWLALRRTSMEPAGRARTWTLIAVPLLLWLALVWLVSVRGTLVVHPGVYLQPIALAIALPAVIGTFLLTRSERVAQILDATPPIWLIGFQFYRVMGGVFLALYAEGLLPGEFALPAGIGDVLVGVLALALALRVASGGALNRTAAYAWNILGVADFVGAVATGFLTSPGPIQLWAFDHPNTLISAYPLVMIPAFAVPLSLILHVLSLWQLNRQMGNTAEAKGELGASSYAHS